MPEVRARIAWLLAGVTVVFVATDVAISAQAVPLLSETAIGRPEPVMTERNAAATPCSSSSGG